MDGTFVVGTRTSKLAMWQTRRVIELLRAAWGDLSCQTRPFTTKGDRTLDRPLPEIGGKGLFTLELEEALRAGEIDAAVHSLKDLPVEDAPSLVVGAVTARAPAEDCLVARDGRTLETLPAGAVVGTSSVRRRAQLLAIRPDLEVRSIRGNVETRVRKVVEGEYDAAVMARAGLERLGLADRIADVFELDDMLPAPGQGALAVQCRAGDERVLRLLSKIDDAGVRAAVSAERSFLEGLGGGCSAPVGAFALPGAGGRIVLRAVVGSPDGTKMIRLRRDGADPTALGRELAREALAGGARAILAEAGVPPLAGKRVVVTRAGPQSAAFCEKLRGAGATPVVIPAIRIVAAHDPGPLRRAISRLGEYEWVVFTSANGVEYVWRELESRGQATRGMPAGLRVAAVGSATAAELARRGLNPDFVPEKFVGEQIARGLQGVSGKSVCLFRARVAGDELPRVLEARGARVDDVPVYETEPADIGEEALAELARGVDVVTFTSGSTVRNFVAAVRRARGLEGVLDAVACACIGPVTADAARASGLNVAVVSGVHTTDGLVDALVDYYRQGERT